MTKKLAVAIIHGMGTPPKSQKGNMHKLKQSLHKEFANNMQKRHSMSAHEAYQELQIEPINWADELQADEDILWTNLRKSGSLGHYITRKILRQFMIDYLGDPLAYRREKICEEPDATQTQSPNYYVEVHKIVASVFNTLAKNAGEDAPLSIIGHSLGTVIASNYIYDLQDYNNQQNNDLLDEPCNVLNPPIPYEIKKFIEESPLTMGKTLTHFFTLGSPLALWSLRFHDTDLSSPICVPDTHLSNYHSHLQGQWVNFYAPNDIIGYPLKNVPGYDFVKDITVNTWAPYLRWFPWVHSIYWTNHKVIQNIANTLTLTWETVNNIHPN